MTQAMMSALTVYLLYVVDERLRMQFVRQTHDIHDNYSQYGSGKEGKDLSKQFYSTNQNLGTVAANIPVTSGITRIIYNLDGNGKKIDEKSPLYELSDTITKFNEGRNSKFTKKEAENLKLYNPQMIESYFNTMGKNFAAGYLSRFGLIARDRGGERPFFYNTKILLKKIKEKDAYNAALSVWYCPQKVKL